ncbi:MAG TPA: flagellar biosynthesis protein FlhA [Gemmatimonadaceae bacterium]|nr:flagellar biosynthesis protein FlhA [Gemmatimonadaceae bacterium]
MSTARTASATAPIGSGRITEIGVALAIVFVIALLILPLPPFFLDLFLSLSIGLALVVLLVALYTTDALEFSSFPSVLLLLTLFRLALNVSSTRLILAQGHAGKVIQVFGQFVIGGNYAVGLVLFLILVGINFIVITKGAGRVAEVAARFTLDAMPGKQMAIDADLGAGLIDEATARERRAVISRQADFYGAMDGASKFVKGDAIAGLLITGINIAGGIFVGVVQRGLPIGQAAATYTVLTVGDGLVTQIPALIVSTAAGLMVTHASSGTRLGNVLAKQIGGQPRALYVAAGTLCAFALVPGLPSIPFLLLGGAFAALARTATTRAATIAAEQAKNVQPAEEVTAPANPVADLLQLDPIELELGYALIPLADESQGGDLLERVGMLRKQAALEFGVLIPAIRIRDDIRLPANQYVIKLRGSEVARAEVMARHLLALDTGSVVAPIDGVETTDPSFGMPARWIAPSRRTEAEAMGYTVVEATTMIATHLMETLKANAADLLGRQDVQEMLDTIKRTNPALVEELIPSRLSLGALHRVLQRLLRERVPIRDLITILEAVGDAADQTKDPEQLAEHARRALSHVLAKLYSDDQGVVRAITLGPKLEASLLTLLAPRAASAQGALLGPDQLVTLLRDLQSMSAERSEGRAVPLLVPPGLRIGIRRLVEPVMPGMPVLSLAELPPAINLNTVATWEMQHAA